MVQLTADESLIDTIANAPIGKVLDIHLSAGVHTLPSVIDAASTPSEIWITGDEPGAVLSSDLTLQPGAPAVHIRGFTITGQIEVIATQRPVEIAECSFEGALVQIPRDFDGLDGLDGLDGFSDGGGKGGGETEMSAPPSPSLPPPLPQAPSDAAPDVFGSGSGEVSSGEASFGDVLDSAPGASLNGAAGGAAAGGAAAGGGDRPAGGGDRPAGRRLSELTAERPALLLSASSARVEVRNSNFTRQTVGIEVRGGSLNLTSSSLSSNRIGLKATGGEVFVMNGTIMQDCQVALAVGGTADVTLTGETALRDSGHAILLGSGGEVRYRLPAPLGYYVFIADGGDVSRIEGNVEGDYPYMCSAGIVGNSYSKQSNPSCSELCPRGHYCPPATVVPLPCRAGTFCPLGSPAEVECPEGTASANTMLSRRGDCEPCPEGYACPRGTVTPNMCPLGTHAPVPRSATCDPCPEGTYQDRPGSAACKICYPGAVCAIGTAVPQRCLAGTYSREEGLVNRSQCLDCPLGYFCQEGCSEPEPCYAGRRGERSRLGDPLACTPCAEGTTSSAGSSTCDMCTRGNYKLPQSVGNATTACEECIEHATCPTNNLTIRTLVVDAAHWRLGPLSQDVYACSTSSDGWSPCRGGVDASDLRQGVGDGPVQRLYCEEGYEGPLCELCSNSSTYFDKSEKRCLECPEASHRVTAIIGIAAALFLVLVGAAFFFLRPARGVHLRVQRAVGLLLRQLLAKIYALALVPKLKLFISFFQCAMALPSVYNVSLPDSYYKWTAFMDFMSIDWSGFAIPGACLPGGYYSRLLLGGIGPLVLLALVFIFMFPVIVASQIRAARNRTTSQKKTMSATVLEAIGQAGAQTLPIVLFTSFCLCAPTASSIFATWSCAEYTEDSLAGTGRSYLRADKRMQCATLTASGTELTEEYERVVAAAIPLVVVWAVLMPLLFFGSVQPCSAAIRRSRSTKLVRATAFLHREYEPQYYFWEAVFLFQRLLLVGFVQFIPREYEHLRLLAGMFVALLYLILVLSTKPYKRDDIDALAILLQVTLVLLLLAAQNVQLFNSLEEWYGVAATERVLGIKSLDVLVVIMVVCNLLVVGTFVFMMVYQTFSQQSNGLFRLIASNHPPDLVLNEEKIYHLFLSHVWSTGQDQCAVIKRQLNLLLPGISVFLDVDDLEDIGALEKYVEQTQCMLLLLTRGYFHSRNCLREVDATLGQQKPYFLVHEADEAKGGGPLSALKSECASKRPELAEALFNEDEQVIVRWHRVADFQLLTLRLIAERAIAATLAPGTDGIRGSMLYARGEIQRKIFGFPEQVVLYTSSANPGAAAVAGELADKFAKGNALFATTQRRPGGFTEYEANEEEGWIDYKEPSPPSVKVVRASGRFKQATELSFRRRSSRLPMTPGAEAEATHMVLYLNEETFAGEAGAVLAHELREARARGMPIEIYHECDPARAGCEFAKFFTTTPEDLLAEGLYSQLAIALQPGAHREVSLALCAKSLGAIEKGGSYAGAKKDLENATSSGEKEIVDVARALERGSKARALAKQ